MKTKYVERPEVNEVYADAVKRVTFHEGVVYIDFAVTRMDEVMPPKEPTATQLTAVRLALAASAGLQLRDNLDGLLGLLEKQGIVKRMQVPQTPTAAH